MNTPKKSKAFVVVFLIGFLSSLQGSATIKDPAQIDKEISIIEESLALIHIVGDIKGDTLLNQKYALEQIYFLYCDQLGPTKLQKGIQLHLREDIIPELTERLLENRESIKLFLCNSLATAELVSKSPVTIQNFRIPSNSQISIWNSFTQKDTLFNESEITSLIIEWRDRFLEK